MFRRLTDFEKSWETESEATLKLLRALSDASLGVSGEEGGRTIGRLAWHIVVSVAEMMERTGLELKGPAPDAAVPASAAAIVAAYEELAASLDDEIRLDWTDQKLDSEDEMYGEKWKRGFTLMVLILHQAHHRGQLTVLMRKAGLKVPGIYGPAREEWASMGMEPPTV
jgi:uncharacterized damage-inducible protein DinB